MFEFCPSCGKKDIVPAGPKELYCNSCSFSYFHNVAAAVVAILELDGKVLLIRRAKDPGKGKLDLPGGFVDPKENAEEAIKREVREELNVDLESVNYIGSSPNIYEYKGVTYQTCDVFFYAPINAPPTDSDKREVAELLLMEPAEIPLDELAFVSTRTVLSRFVAARADHRRQ
ncbi:MAG: NUDIX domain-containing protein [Phycisphaerales bacterium]|nr:MAG: NUDIX domain-containing protein [Phycisphaerales bacterium]